MNIAQTALLAVVAVLAAAIIIAVFWWHAGAACTTYSMEKESLNIYQYGHLVLSVTRDNLEHCAMGNISGPYSDEDRVRARMNRMQGIKTKNYSTFGYYSTSPKLWIWTKAPSSLIVITPEHSEELFQSLKNWCGKNPDYAAE